jgi:hypothetical protein
MSAASLAIGVVARHHRVPVARLRRPRGHGDRRLRQLAAYLVVVSAGQSLRRTAAEIGISRTQVSRVLADIEDRRDDPIFDSLVSRLEQRLQEIVA